MINAKTTLSVLLLLGVSSVSFGDICQLVYPGYQSGSTFDGPTKCALGTSDGISVNGPLGTSDTKFTGSVLVRGPLNASSGRFRSLTVDGPLKGQSIDVRGSALVEGPVNLDKSHLKDVSISGPLTATKSNFEDIQMRSDYASLTDCHLKNLSMKNSKESYQNTKLYLEGKTLVTGDITFIGKSGVIYKGSEVVIKGKVVNGSIKS